MTATFPTPVLTAPLPLSGPAPSAVVAPRFHRADAAPGAVFQTVVAEGPIAREHLAKATGLSSATVNRQTAALLQAGLLRERADLSAPGAVGRPRIPVEVNHEAHAVVGVHIGAALTTIVVADLRGRILDGQRLRTPAGDQAEALRAVARSAAEFVGRGAAGRWRRRTPLWAGVALGGRVDARTGTADHPRLGWQQAPVGEVLGSALGVPVSVSAHVEAMAAAELLIAPRTGPQAGSSLYFYARETAGVALTIDGKVHTPSGGPGSLAHLPTGSGAECYCGRRGCLEATVSDQATLQAAVGAGMFADGGEASLARLHRAAQEGQRGAVRVLRERARVLGRTVAVLRDLFNPDQVVLGGQAFTDYPPAMREFGAAFDETTTLAGRNVFITGFGGHVQEYAATAAALSVLHADPLNAMRRSGAA